MRKLLIASVSVLALSAGAAFAQTLIDQVAPLAKTPVTSVYGGISGNQSYIDQIGSNNTIGASTATGVDQTVTGTSANYSEVYQGFSGGTTSSHNAKASVTQEAGGGVTNVSRIYQQDADNDASHSNEAYTTQKITSGTGATSSLEQNGSNLKAKVNQTGAGASSNLYQTGTGGSSNVNQISNNAQSVIVQSGAGNNYIGTDHTAYNIDVQQTGSSTNISGASQSGDNGAISVSQSGALGLLNNSQVFQASSASSATIIQDGTSGTGFNTSLVNQSLGAGNQASVTQHANAGAYENYSNIQQTGGAYASLTQTTAGVGDNHSGINQDGDSFAYLAQTSTVAANMSTITQNGGGNVANVNQH